MKPANLYAAAQCLRRKGYLTANPPSTFARIDVESSAGDAIELKTQLPNGQLIWMSVPGGQLGHVLKVLSA